MKLKNPTRYVNDTFPMMATIELSGDCINITEDNIYFYYNKFTEKHTYSVGKITILDRVGE